MITYDMDQMSIGPVPIDENCAQVGSDDYAPRSRAESRIFVDQLRRQFGEEPDGARLAVTSNPHDFGNYRDVVVKYDPACPEAREYAFKIENETPAEWDETSRRQLAIAGFPVEGW